MAEHASEGSVDAQPGNHEGAAEHPLLDIQRLDTEIEQLRRRREALALRGELQTAQERLKELQRGLDALGEQRREVLVRQGRLENEAGVIQARADKDDTRLYSGEVTGIRDLQALQDEIAALRRRQGELEEAAIAALLEAEELMAKTDRLTDERAGCEEQVTVLQAELAASEAELDEQIDLLVKRRAQTATRSDPSAITRYESLRDMFGPSTAVAFDATRGCGCPHQMPTAEVARLKRCEPGAVLDCSECGRLVLR